jgi:hypothetical protein
MPVSRVLFSFSRRSLHHLSMRPTLRDRTGHPSPGSEKINTPGIPGLHGLTARKVCLSYCSYLQYWWALTPPFHLDHSEPWQFKFLQHCLSSCSRPHDAPAFNRVRCPLQPGLSSLHITGERWSGRCLSGVKITMAARNGERMEDYPKGDERREFKFSLPTPHPFAIFSTTLPEQADR